MNVKEQIALLIQLQETDTKVNQLQQRKKTLPMAIEAASSPLEAARKELETVKQELELHNKEKRKKEEDLREGEEKIERLKRRTSEIKTNKEYQAHLLEVEGARQEKGRIEEELLLVMERIDALVKEIAQKERVVAEAEKQCAKERVRLEKELVQLGEELGGVERERGSVVDLIDRDLFKEYHQLIVAKKGLAVVQIKGGTCTGCQLKLPPQLVAEVRKQEKIHFCSHCHRILYWPGEVSRAEMNTLLSSLHGVEGSKNVPSVH